MRNSLKYRYKKFKKSKFQKAQFFILSAFIITSIMYLISRWIEPTKIIDTSSVVLLEEPFIFNNIIEKAREIINTTKDCSLLQLNLDEYKNFVESLTSEKGFLLNFTYSIRNCQNVELNITLASEKMTISSFVPITSLPS